MPVWIEGNSKRGRARRRMAWTSGGIVVQHAPVIYQKLNGTRRAVKGGYVAPELDGVGKLASHERIAARLAQRYDFVIVDSPPLIPVSDAVILSARVDGVVLVVDLSRTPKRQIKAARARLESARARVFGFVLNKMHPKSFRYQYYYNDYYVDDQVLRVRLDQSDLRLEA